MDTVVLILSASVALIATTVALAVGALWLRARRARLFAVPEESSNSVVIISGCDSGFGRETTLKLLARGFHVIATTFTKEGPRQLAFDAQSFPGELSTCHVDITSEESVERLVVLVETLLDLHPQKTVVGLVNNAGAAFLGPIEVQSLDHFIRQHEVNLFGHVRMTQALLSFVRDEAKTAGGRVVNICSIAGRVAAPGMGAYASSKFALEAVTDALRREVRDFGISVSAVEPGFMKTPIVGNTDHDKNFASWNPECRELYRGFNERAKKNTERTYEKAGDPLLVADVIVHALTAPRPRTHYLVGKDAHFFAFLGWLLPDSFLDELIALAL